ncbi:GumC family protein [Celeribacter halophilus]|uniref:non-specific protein-tyrosine kinase n=1 Tax=Celeribacter halophilus TaxID=576117 RepID=A0A1I3WIZ8_9RHOB|nr:polysaccharide biosynthesis tyrosine autokinase [Celeribacter halophilus]PZX09847.1 capsular exopolysaccharide synthesis family protein [Celeribacter halophilus]SFK06837.1 capsular exopolysaccharide family [Celeribacter halophilus]
MTYNTATSDDDVIDLGALLSSLWRKKIWIFASILGFAILGALYAFVIATPKYRATSVILLEASGEQLLDLGAVLPSLGTDSEAINTEVEVLKSRRLLERVVTTANLIEDPEFNGALKPLGLKANIKNFITGQEREVPTRDQQLTSVINAMLDRMSVRNVPSTYVLQVTVETEDPHKSVMLADTMAEQYILYQMDVKFEATKDASEWLTSRVADLKADLEQAEARVSEFSTNSEVVSIETVQALERQLKEQRDRLVTMRISLENDRARLERLTTAAHESADAKLEAADDPRLTTIYRENGEAEAFDMRYAQLLTQASVQVQRTQAQVQSLETSIKTREADIARQSDELIQLQQLTREAEASRLLYEYFLSRLKETSAQEGIQQADSRILSNAVLPQGPSEPRKSLILAMSIILGAMVGSGLALVWEMRQNGYRLASDLEVETGLPVMGQIPLLPTSNRREGLEYLAEKPASAAAEAIRNLRTSVLLSGLDEAPKVIMSTSSLPSEGKTTVSFALAQNLVGLGKKVLLVEGDIRRLVFAQYLDVKDAKGLMSVLSGDISLEEAVIHDPILGADILASEPSNVNAADIVSSQRFADFIKAARDAYDMVIIDTPPVLVVPDARVVAQHVDVVLFTVRWDSTSKTQVRDALHMFETVGVKVSGLVLNQIDPKGMKQYGYGESYGAYGSYGAKYYTE